MDQEGSSTDQERGCLTGEVLRHDEHKKDEAEHNVNDAQVAVARARLSSTDTEIAEPNEDRRDMFHVNRPVILKWTNNGEDGRNDAKADKSKQKKHDANDFGGSCGWGYVNVGANGEKTPLTEQMEQIMKRHPATILGFGEASVLTERAMQSPPDAGLTEEELTLKNLPTDHQLRRPSFEYFTMRGNEKASVMIAARKDHVEELQCLACRIFDDGEYTEDGKTMSAVSRIMVCKIVLKGTMGDVIKNQTVMNVHMHKQTASLAQGEPTLRRNLNEMFKLITKLNVKVLMGDFNASLTSIVPMARHRGLDIDLAAWFPWKSVDGAPMMDTTAIFFINLAGAHILDRSNDAVHDRDGAGFLHHASVERTGKDRFGWHRMDKADGPGETIESYLSSILCEDEPLEPIGIKPKTNMEKVTTMLSPSSSSEVIRKMLTMIEKKSRQSTHVFCTEEKRLFFRLQGQQCTAIGHYPLWCKTQIPSKIYPEKYLGQWVESAPRCSSSWWRTDCRERARSEQDKWNSAHTKEEWDYNDKSSKSPQRKKTWKRKCEYNDAEPKENAGDKGNAVTPASPQKQQMNPDADAWAPQFTPGAPPGLATNTASFQSEDLNMGNGGTDMTDLSSHQTVWTSDPIYGGHWVSEIYNYESGWSQTVYKTWVPGQRTPAGLAPHTTTRLHQI